VNGPQHYADAERLLKAAADALETGDLDAAKLMHAAAQVHATLALVAATVSMATYGAGFHALEWAQATQRKL
jgi:hypothetical protein